MMNETKSRKKWLGKYLSKVDRIIFGCIQNYIIKFILYLYSKTIRPLLCSMTLYGLFFFVVLLFGAYLTYEHLSINSIASAVEKQIIKTEAQTPEVQTLEAQTPEAQTPEAQTPEAQTPEVQTLEAQIPEAQIPEAQTLEAQTLEENENELFRKFEDDSIIKLLKIYLTEMKLTKNTFTYLFIILGLGGIYSYILNWDGRKKINTIEEYEKKIGKKLNKINQSSEFHVLNGQFMETMKERRSVGKTDYDFIIDRLQLLVEKDKNNISYKFELASVFSEITKYNKAIKQYKKIVKILKKKKNDRLGLLTENYLYYKISDTYRLSGEFEKAIENVKKISFKKNIRNNSNDRITQSQTFNLHADILVEQAKKNDALSNEKCRKVIFGFYEKAIKSDNNNYLAYASYSNALRECELCDDAMEKIKNAINIIEQDSKEDNTEYDDWDQSSETKRNKADLYRSCAGLYVAKAKYDVAITMLRKALKITPRFSMLYADMALSLNYLGERDKDEYLKAIDMCEKALILEIFNTTANNNMAYSYEKLGDYNKSQKYYEEAINCKDFDSENELALNYAYVGYGRLLNHIGGYVKAEKVCRHCKDIDIFPEALVHLGKALYKQDKYIEAHVELDKAIALNKVYTKAFEYKIKAYCEEGDGKASLGNNEISKERYFLAIKSGEEYFKNVNAHSKQNGLDSKKSFDKEQHIIYNEVGEAYRRLEKYEDALAQYKKAVEIKPDYAKAQYHIAEMQEINDKYDDAKVSYEQAVRLFEDLSKDRNEIDSPIRIIYWAKSLCYLGKLDRAIEVLDNAIKVLDVGNNLLVSPDKQLSDTSGDMEKDDSRFVGIGDILLDISQYEKAIECYNKAIQNNSRSTNAYLNRGKAYYQIKQFNEAEEDFKKFFELHKELFKGEKTMKAEALNNLGKVYYRKNQFEDAKETYIEAIKTDINVPGYYSNLGEVYKVLSKNSSAKNEYNKAKILLEKELKDGNSKRKKCVIQNELGNAFFQLYELENEPVVDHKTRDTYYLAAIDAYTEATLDSSEKQIMIEAYCHLAELYLRFESKNWVYAVQHCQKALSVDPNCSNAYYLLGDIAYTEGDDFTSCGNSESKPDDKVITKADWHFNRAIEYYSKAVEFNEFDDDAYANMGAAYLNLGLYIDGIQCLEKARTLNSYYADYNLACAYAMLYGNSLSNNDEKSSVSSTIDKIDSNISKEYYGNYKNYFKIALDTGALVEIGLEEIKNDCSFEAVRKVEYTKYDKDEEFNESDAGMNYYDYIVSQV